MSGYYYYFNIKTWLGLVTESETTDDISKIKFQNTSGELYVLEFPRGTNWKYVKSCLAKEKAPYQIHYEFESEPYILPVIDHFKVIELIDFPPGKGEMKFKQLYCSMKSQNYDENHTEFKNEIQKYAGPYGDFYKDTGLYVKTDQLEFPDGEKILTGKDDYLTLENDLGENFSFRYGEVISI